MLLLSGSTVSPSWLEESTPPSQLKTAFEGKSLAIQRLGLCTFTAEGAGSIPGRGTKIPTSLRAQPKKTAFKMDIFYSTQNV